MALWNFLRTALIAPLLNLRLWLLQFFGNALLIAVFAWFLHIGDGYTSQIVLSATLVLLMVAGLLVLHGGTMNCALDSARMGRAADLKPALKRVAVPLLPLLIWAVVFYLLESWVDKLDDYQYSFPGWLRSEFPAWLRRMISEPGMGRAYSVCVSFVRWTLVPGLLLPLGVLCADLGFRGLVSFRAWARILRRLRYWIVLVIAGLLGVYCTGALMKWTLDPQTASLMQEEIWLGSRLLVGYLLAIAAWLITCTALANAHREGETSGVPAETPEPKPVLAANATAKPEPGATV